MRRLLILSILIKSLLSCAQTTYTLGTAKCTQSMSCLRVPIVETGTTLDIILDPYPNPMTSRYIVGIPNYPAGTFAPINFSEGYRVAPSLPVSYITPDRSVWIADVPLTQTLTPCVVGQPCHTHQVPKIITVTFFQVDFTSNVPQKNLTGTGTFTFGNYYYIDQCSDLTEDCGWHWSIINGKIIVN